MRGDSRGFTMVEVMVVALFLGIVAAVAVPSLNNTFYEMKLNSAAREVVSAIQYAQSLAIKEGEGHSVNFQIMHARFFCQNIVTSVTCLHPTDKKPFFIKFKEEGPLKGIEIVSAAFGAASKSSIDFDSLGSTVTDGTVVLAYAGFQKTINVSAPLGKISIN